MRGRISRCFAPHPNPLPMNLAIRCLIAVKSIVAKFTGRGDFYWQASQLGSSKRHAGVTDSSSTSFERWTSMSLDALLLFIHLG